MALAPLRPDPDLVSLAAFVLGLFVNAAVVVVSAGNEGVDARAEA
jgi:hypothetical protein